jgi:hypothetical protein
VSRKEKENHFGGFLVWSVTNSRSPEVSKSLTAIDHEGEHASVDREIREKALWEKASIEELKLPKPEESKW